MTILTSKNKLSAGASASDLIFEVIPDETVPFLNTRVCRTEITHVGSNLPCIQARQLIKLVNFCVLLQSVSQI